MAEMTKFYKGQLSGLPASGVNGALYITTDEGAIYLGTGSGMKRLGDFVQVADIASLPTAGANASALYYCVSENVLAKWNGTEWVQINKQRTAAEIKELIGLADYELKSDAAQKLVDAKAYTDTEVAAVQGEIDALETYVGTIPADAGVASVVAYVDKKTSGIATDASLKELQEKVSAAESDIDALQAATAEGGAVTQAIADAAAAAKAAQDTADSKTTMAEVEAKGYQTAAQVQAIADGKDEAIGAAQTRADEAYALAETKTTMADVEAKNYATKSEAQGYADAKDEAIAAALKAGEDAQTDVDALYDIVGDVTEDMTVVEMIAKAQADATYDDTALVGRVAAIEGDYLKKADKDALQSSIDANASAIELLTNGVSAEEVDGVNDLIQYVKDHGTEVTGMKGDIKANADAIDAIEADYLKAADKTELQNAIDGVAGRMTTAEGEIDALQADSHTHSNKVELDKIAEGDKAKWDAAEGNAKAYADELNGAMDERMLVVEGKAHEHANKAELDLIASGDKAKWDEAYAKRHEHANKAELDLIESGDKAKWDAAQANAEATAAGALSAAKTELEGKISAAETAAKGHAESEAGKVQTALDTYKTENDAAVALKANSADVYAKADTYTQAEVNAAIEAALEEANSWGSF